MNLADKDFSLPKLEEKILKFWEENKIFEKSLKKTKKGKPFTFYDGPPFATGLPHYGHILASTIKDVVPRYQTMRGGFVRRRWGWDCHGLPIEEIVERKLGISGKKQIEEIGIKKFNETCRSVVLDYAAEWGKMIRRIARWVEFDDSYKTMDTDYMESVWWAFKQFYKKGLVYEGRKVLLYCPRCETPVSNFEVAMDDSYREVAEESVTVKFKFTAEAVAELCGRLRGSSRNSLNNRDNVYVLSWTTTPWTLPGNVALAVGKDIVYVIAKQNGDYFIIAKNLVGKTIGQQTEIIGEIKGKDLVGLKYKPLFDVAAVESDKSFRVYPADFVTTEEGTGVVHTAVVYGEEDYELGVREGLPIVPLLDEKGKFNEKAPRFLQGIYFKDAERNIKKHLEDRGLLFKREMHTHSYPYCWRCGTALFYNAIPAWFVNMKGIRPILLRSNNREINWFPEHLKHGRYEKSVEAAPDWNISRNRYWGNPIPVWKCDKCGERKAVESREELSRAIGKPRNRYILMRHGESENNRLDIINNNPKELDKYPLTLRGRAQAEAAAKKLKKEEIGLIIASDFKRTAETAEIIREKFNIKEGIVFDQRIREVNTGVYDGKSGRDYRNFFGSIIERFTKTPEKGESLRDMCKRVYDFISEIEDRYEGKTILVVTHEYDIWALETVMRGWSEEESARAKATNDDFVKNAEWREVPLGFFPRNDFGIADLHRPYIDHVVLDCSSCKGRMRRTPEIFDSWMEAGSMPFAEYHYPFENRKVFKSRFPAQFVAEYIAQTRAWFYLMHVVSVVLFGKAPFKNVVTTGTILAEDGSKMSKSKNNYPDPWRVIEKYGADSLRFYLMNSVVMRADNLNFSEKGVEEAHRKVGLLLLNVYKYFATYVPRENLPENKKGASSKTNILDLWIKTRTEELVADVTKFLEKYDTVHATRTIQEYVSDLSTWYLRRSRKRDDVGFFSTLRESLIITSKVVAPFMPFLAEFIYRKLIPKGRDSKTAESVHLADWPALSKKSNVKSPAAAKAKVGKKKLIEEMEEVRRIASVALSKRAELGIKVRQPLQKLNVKSDKLKGKKELLEILLGEVNVKEAIFDPKQKEEVVLDTKITPELREEGVVREFVRMIQDLRRDAGLHPRDVVFVMMECSRDIEDIIQKNEATLKKEVNAKSIEYKKSEKFNAEISTKFEEKPLWLGLRKIK